MQASAGRPAFCCEHDEGVEVSLHMRLDLPLCFGTTGASSSLDC